MAMNKRQKAISAAVVPGKAYAFDEAVKIIKTATKAKFVESVDVAVRLGVDAKKSDQQVRGSTVLPAGTGKSVRVAVFAPAGAKADEALAAGARRAEQRGLVPAGARHGAARLDSQWHNLRRRVRGVPVHLVRAAHQRRRGDLHRRARAGGRGARARARAPPRRRGAPSWCRRSRPPAGCGACRGCRRGSSPACPSRG